MTNLEILDGHIERQSEICAAAALRLEVLLLARHVLKGGTADAPYAVSLQVEPVSVSLHVMMQGGAQAGMSADVLARPIVEPSDIAPEVGRAVVVSAAEAAPANEHADEDCPDDLAPVIDNRSAIASEWSEDDVANLRKRFEAGESMAGIARALDKSPKQVSNKSFRLGLRRGGAGSKQELPAKPVPTRSRAHASPKAAKKVKPQSSITQRLDALGNNKLWTPLADLDLALAFVRGDKAAKIALTLKLDPSDVTDRWQALCPNRNDKSAINGLLRELKARADV
ncbi:hypothetical protein [Loktanella salsilacus]|uniref:hypothetical protein n=1 Tax=Loktanella salsilacus TaxID=195913 RepID=UPI0037048C7A